MRFWREWGEHAASLRVSVANRNTAAPCRQKMQGVAPPPQIVTHPAPRRLFFEPGPSFTRRCARGSRAPRNVGRRAPNTRLARAPRESSRQRIEPERFLLGHPPASKPGAPGPHRVSE